MAPQQPQPMAPQPLPGPSAGYSRQLPVQLVPAIGAAAPIIQQILPTGAQSTPTSALGGPMTQYEVRPQQNAVPSYSTYHPIQPQPKELHRYQPYQAIQPRTQERPHPERHINWKPFSGKICQRMIRMEYGTLWHCEWCHNPEKYVLHRRVQFHMVESHTKVGVCSRCTETTLKLRRVENCNVCKLAYLHKPEIIAASEEARSC